MFPIYTKIPMMIGMPQTLPAICDRQWWMLDVGPSSLRELSTKTSTLSWDDIIWNDQVKKMLQQAIEWPIAKRSAFRELDLNPPRGILLYGPPGCAKTSLAKAAARGRAFCSFSPADSLKWAVTGNFTSGSVVSVLLVAFGAFRNDRANKEVSFLCGDWMDDWERKTFA